MLNLGFSQTTDEYGSINTLIEEMKVVEMAMD